MQNWRFVEKHSAVIKKLRTGNFHRFKRSLRENEQVRETFDLKNISPGAKFPDESCPTLRYILVLQRLCIQSLSLICFRFKTISKILVKSSLDGIYLSLSTRPALTALSEVTKLACREYLNKFVIYDIWVNSKNFCHCFKIIND